LRFQIDVVDPKAEMEALKALGGFDGARVLEIGCGISARLFMQEGESTFTVVHRFNDAVQLLADVETWTGTRVPRAVRKRLQRAVPSFEVQEGARLRRLRAL
jgi:hypothetical protein